MKINRFLLILSLFINVSIMYAQGYEKEWKTIDSLTNKGLPESALKETEALMAKIRADKNNKNQTALFVKVLIFFNKFQAQLEEDGLVNAIVRFQVEMEKASGPTKAVMQSMLAEMYTQYLYNNSYKFSDRTAVTDQKSDDITTWDIPKLTDKVFELYSASVQDKSIKNVKLTDYKDLLSSDFDEELQPTLYDFLINRAIAFYSNESSYLTKPAYRFYIDEPKALGDLNGFVNQKFEARDSLSNKFRCLLMYQELLRFHQNDADPSALINAEIRRLSWVYGQSIIGDKDALYLQSLKNIAAKYTGNPASAEALYSIATWHEGQGNQYKPSPEQTFRWELKTAKELAVEIIKKFPGSYGAQSAEALISRIELKNFTFSAEWVVAAGKPSLANLSHRNISKVYLKLIQLTDRELREIAEISYDQPKLVKFLNDLKVKETWNYTLINEGDYQTHSTDIRIPATTNGSWIVVGSENENFQYSKNGLSYIIFNVSNLTYSQRQKDGIYEFIVTDRNSGQPLKAAKAEFYLNKYNSLLRRNEYRKIGEGFTDENGLVSTASVASADYYSFFVKFSYDNDVLFLNNGFYNYKANKLEYVRTTVHFFTDRAIYRPGQTIYFKGIAIQNKNNKEHKIVPGYKADVIFYDANYQEVARKSVVANEFGSFQGTFTAPSGGMLGIMSLKDINGNGSHTFRVEEYKRPKFEVTFKPMKESYRLNDKVTVKGEAKAYAGSNIDGAKVQFRVVRNVEFPYWRWWYWGWNPWQRSEQEIAFGEIKTNEKGEYAIEFTAIPDKSIPVAQKPQFSYTIYADVTDITGETHSTQTYVYVGTVALSANIEVSENLNREKADYLEIITQNLNGEFEAAKGTVKVELLETPDRIFNNRLTDVGDYQLISESDFRRDFPHFSYKNEDQSYNWKALKTVLQVNFDTKTNKKLGLKEVRNWAQGTYKLTMNTQDRFGEKVEVIRYFTLYSEKESTVPTNEALFIAETNLKAEPGEKVSIDFGSFDKNAFIYFELEHEQKIVRSEWIQPQGRRKIELTIEEKHRGGLHYHLSSVLNNRVYNTQGNVDVPWTNKQLEIEYSTFRDKLLPGQEEEWKIKISGLNKDKVAAEVLTGMYDASLDAFASNYWNLSLYGNSWAGLGWASNNYQRSSSNLISGLEWNRIVYGPSHSFASLNWFGFVFYDWGYYSHDIDGTEAYQLKESLSVEDAEPSPVRAARDENIKLIEVDNITSGVSALKGDTLENVITKESKPDAGDMGDVKVRTNLNETVFFFPQMMTDENGDVIIKFTMNEALTRWNFMWLAHTKDLKIGSGQKSVVTQKDLMVMPNAPRFFRQNDEIYFTAKVSNMTEKEMKGEAVLQLFDAISMKPIDVEFANSSARMPFTAAGGQSAPLVWKLKVPDMWTNAVTYRVVAKSGAFSDGEESSLPVLSNRMLVTETMPLPIRGGQTKTFEFKRMAEVSKSTTMRHHRYTLEFTPNPAWYAVQALPYIMEYPYECSEQLFSRFYANSLATTVANSNPKIKKVFDSWKEFQPDALKSNLSKNQELKYALLEETPWVMAAQSEEQQKRDLGVLFDLNRMANEMTAARDKLIDRQLASGGFAWFPGGSDSWYITQYIVEGMGHLDELGVKLVKADNKVNTMMERAVKYIDEELAESYLELLKNAKVAPEGEKAYLEKDHLGYMEIHYLYARSFYPEIKVSNANTKKAIEYYEGQAKKYWLGKSDYMQGMLALSLHRKGIDKETPMNIVKSLKERALKSEEMGMYWQYPHGYFWYEMPIETHCLLIEVFDVVAKDAAVVEELKTYLIKSKQTTHWQTTKATASACYALLKTGDNWLMEDQEVKITLGTQVLDQSKIAKEAGTGYFKTSFDAPQIKNEMATVKVENPNKNVAWGAVYWQYFEQLDKITHFKETPLTINKKLFKEVKTDRGPVLQPITTQTKLVPGDLVKVRIELKVDRDMEYVHMKDMRASGFEPVNVLSQYKYQGGLGYYESTRDAATNFFFSYLSKGNYVFEYGLLVNHKGDFSNGITTIQCMYAPEFTSHSEGVRVKVE